jgi:HK97 gp10 family phage protein
MQQTPKGGRTYQRGSKSHTASTPGSPPAIDYGNLINSVQSKRDGKDAVVFTNAESAPPLEFGTAKMQARPFMRPAAENFKVDAAKAVEATAKRKLDEAAR